MDRLQLACSADEAYAPHSAAMLHSVLANRGRAEIAVHYLHGPRFPAAVRSELERMVVSNGGAIEFHEIADERVRGLPALQQEGLTVPLWYRVFLAELLPDVDRVLYLDADTLAVDSLEPLWTTELGDHYLAAVTNVFMRDHADRPQRLGIEHPYFNNGVMLLNLELWRREEIGRRLVDYARANRDRLGWTDQDSINILLGHRRLPLHPRWNAMNSVIEFPWSAEVFGARAVEEARSRPGIRHFEGPSINKPWHYLCTRSLRELYLEHRRQTPWPEVELDGATWRNRARRMLGRARRRVAAEGERTGQPMVSA
jgi:lipopolysaccharide biosynthesis glycosyltransferase